MNRITAGAPAAFTYDVGATGGAYTVKVMDSLNRYVEATAETSDPNVTVNIAAKAWRDGTPGFGWLEIMDENRNIVKAERFKILAGARARYEATPTHDYRGEWWS